MSSNGGFRPAMQRLALVLSGWLSSSGCQGGEEVLLLSSAETNMEAAGSESGMAALPPLRGVQVESQVWHSGNVLEDYLAVQGTPRDVADPFEIEAWTALGLEQDTIPLLSDDGPFPFGIRVIRSKVAIATARGPFGPRRDLWLDVSEWETVMEEGMLYVFLNDDGSGPFLLELEPLSSAP